MAHFGIYKYLEICVSSLLYLNLFESYIRKGSILSLIRLEFNGTNSEQLPKEDEIEEFLKVGLTNIKILRTRRRVLTRSEG